MQKAIIGKKVGMTQIFDESGKVIPVTVVEAGPCTVTQLKTVEKDGYAAVQLGYQDVKESKLTKPEAGHLKKANVALKKVLKEFRLENSTLQVGDEVKADVFAAGDKIDVTGISKGHGYQGVIKRFGAQRTQKVWQSTKDCQAFFAHCTSKTAGPKLRSTLETGIFDAEQGKLPQAPFVVVKAI